MRVIWYGSADYDRLVDSVVCAHSSVMSHGLALLYGINSFIVRYITKNQSVILRIRFNESEHARIVFRVNLG